MKGLAEGRDMGSEREWGAKDSCLCRLRFCRDNAGDTGTIAKYEKTWGEKMGCVTKDFYQFS